MLSIEQVSFYYNKIRALNEISLNIKKGEFVAITGRNGCGKSTLAKLMNGILYPSKGRVKVDGIDTLEEPLKVKRKVGMVFQNPDNQIVALTVEEDVAFGLENIGYPTEKMQERIDWALEVVGLEGFQKRSTDSLSGGQKQRLAIAGIFALNPDYIVLDEPTSMLDPEGRNGVLKIVNKLKKSKTIIYITHNLEEIISADRMIVMDNGSIVIDDIPINILMKKDIKKYGLLTPEFLTTQKCLIEKGYLDKFYSTYEEVEKNIRLGENNERISG